MSNQRTEEIVDYDLLLPGEFARRKAIASVVYQPIGCLEWHGKHLPIGLDGLKAQGICRRVALEHGGIVMPPIHLGIHPPFNMLPVHQGHNVYIDEKCFETLMIQLTEQIERLGFEVIVLVTGHFPKYQGKRLNELAFREMWRRHMKIKILTPDEDHVAEAIGLEVDHAGIWETSVMMELYPDLVKMEQLDDLVGILPVGNDPRQGASKDIGKRACDYWVQHIGDQVRGALTGSFSPSYKWDPAFLQP